MGEEGASSRVAGQRRLGGPQGCPSHSASASWYSRKLLKRKWAAHEAGTSPAGRWLGGVG